MVKGELTDTRLRDNVNLQLIRILVVDVEAPQLILARLHINVVIVGSDDERYKGLVLTVKQGLLHLMTLHIQVRGVHFEDRV